MLHSTLWPAADTLAQLPYDIVQTIDATITAPMPAELSKMGRHFLIQRRLKALGNSLGYKGRAEVSTDEIVKTGPGRLDVVWTHPVADRSIAMEIDSAWRKRSMHKLARKSASQLCLWIYYGAKPVVTDDAGYDLSGVNIMQLDPRVLGIPLRVPYAERMRLAKAFPDQRLAA
jgi:hypothetical protein